MNGLKEWATVVRALEAGDQTVLLRKGGILEAASGFLVESKKFLLFPTYEHQSAENLKPEFAGYLDVVKQRPPEGQNEISSYAEVLAEADLDSEEKIRALSGFHIWSDSYIKTRMSWMPQKSMKAVFVKAYKIPKKQIPMQPEFQGCKSWIDINANCEAGIPALDENEINARLERFLEIVN